MKFNLFQFIFLFLIAFSSCTNESFIKEMFVEPEASFIIPKETFEVNESVVFKNLGKGQRYVVYPGDYLHKYKTTNNVGYSTSSDGSFSYSYSEPGEYTAVWVATSISDKGNVVEDIDSVKIKVQSTNGGLEKFTVYNTYKMTDYSTAVYYSSLGEFISKDTIICPFIFDAWRTSTVVNSVKAPQLINFQLTSNLSKFYWVDNNGAEQEIKSASTASRIINFLKDGKFAVQKFVVKTASGFISNYYVVPLIIPKITKFTVNGVAGTITRDLAYYNRYNISISLPSSTNLNTIVPVFEVMNNDVYLVGDNIEVSVNDVLQQSGVSSIDASSKTVVYKVRSYMFGNRSSKLFRDSYVTVTFL